MEHKKKLLICTDWFYPAYKAGGPITSIVHLVEHLHTEFEVFVLTSAYDLGENTSIIAPERKTNQWINYSNKARVLYLSHDYLNYQKIKKYISDIQPDILYLNSLFSLKFTLFPLLSKKVNHTSFRVVLAPRGMLGTSSLKIKSTKKAVFLKLSRWVGLYQGIVWHATSEKEAIEMKQNFSSDIQVLVAPNFSKKQEIAWDEIKEKSESKPIKRILYVGRISPIKNLLDLLIILQKVQVSVQQTIHLVIVGPAEDLVYYELCTQEAQKLYLHQISWLGEQSPDFLRLEYEKAHVYVSTSKHENFGHSIAEALSYGCPVIVSDQTPWHEVEKARCGKVCSLQNQEDFSQAIEDYIQMPFSEYLLQKERAYQFYSSQIMTEELIQKYKRMFS